MRDISYRTEAAYGEGFRDAIEVMTFETYELGNMDILDTLAPQLQEKYPEISKEMENFCQEIEDNGYVDDMSEEDWNDFYRKVLNAINDITGRDDLKYCLWLADYDVVVDYYGDGKITKEDVDAYYTSDEGKEPVIASDLGVDGRLYLYEEYPEEVYPYEIPEKSLKGKREEEVSL